MSDAALEFGAAVEAAGRAEYERTNKGDWETLGACKRAEIINALRPAVKAAAPYFAAQGWEIGYGDGDGDSRIVGGDYFENPWGDYVQDEG